MSEIYYSQAIIHVLNLARMGIETHVEGVKGGAALYPSAAAIAQPPPRQFPALPRLSQLEVVGDEDVDDPGRFENFVAKGKRAHRIKAVVRVLIVCPAGRFTHVDLAAGAHKVGDQVEAPKIYGVMSMTQTMQQWLLVTPLAT
ncbi:hypothetical protein B0H13DRAFT_1850989 [Mycena leptocephala]|nr:hypothetical protein B0H13DRAFT_1850989 [Mycena leptocephala]